MVQAVVGANWGDEGKGKITDMLAEKADIIVRFQGGANAGHTIVNDYGKFALHTLPSGVFYNHTTSIIGNGVALNIPVLFNEVKSIVDRGVPMPKILVSDRAQMVMSYHILFDQYEENIERVFGCPVFDTYGCSEGIMMAAKKDLDYYYIMTPHVHMEIVDDRGNEVPDGQMGHVVLTRLDGYSMPLIRYHIGDMAVKLPREEYPERRELNYPLLERVVGRDTDVIKVPSGKYMTVHFFTSLFRDIPDIVQFRVVQKTPGEIEIEYIPAESFDPRGLKQVESKINARLGEKYSVKWKKVDHIPPTASGKPQIVQSLIR